MATSMKAEERKLNSNQIVEGPKDSMDFLVGGCLSSRPVFGGLGQKGRKHERVFARGRSESRLRLRRAGLIFVHVRLAEQGVRCNILDVDGIFMWKVNG